MPKHLLKYLWHKKHLVYNNQFCMNRVIPSLFHTENIIQPGSKFSSFRKIQFSALFLISKEIFVCLNTLLIFWKSFLLFQCVHGLCVTSSVACFCTTRFPYLFDFDVSYSNPIHFLSLFLFVDDHTFFSLSMATLLKSP